MHIHVQKTVNTAVPPSSNVLRIAAMFGLGLDDQREVSIIPPTTIELEPHRIVFVTGDSGGGKSTLLGLIGDQLEGQRHVRLLRLEALVDPPDVPLVDCFDGRTLEQTLGLLSRAGLNDALVMLRRPAELSDGQRYRFRLAKLMAAAEEGEGDPSWTVVFADEFGATLDRTTASVLARNIRKWTRTAAVCFIAATTHDDLLEPLEPDVLIDKPLGPDLHLLTRNHGRSG